MLYFQRSEARSRVQESASPFGDADLVPREPRRHARRDIIDRVADRGLGRDEHPRHRRMGRDDIGLLGRPHFSRIVFRRNGDVVYGVPGREPEADRFPISRGQTERDGPGTADPHALRGRGIGEKREELRALDRGHLRRRRHRERPAASGYHSPDVVAHDRTAGLACRVERRGSRIDSHPSALVRGHVEARDDLGLGRAPESRGAHALAVEIGVARIIAIVLPGDDRAAGSVGRKSRTVLIVRGKTYGRPWAPEHVSHRDRPFGHICRTASPRLCRGPRLLSPRRSRRVPC